MPRFLRKIKLIKVFGEDARSIRAFIIGEFVLVFLGILIALQVDNWNQERQEKKLEKVLLSEMRSNLLADLEDIDYNVLVQRQLLNSNRIVLDFLNSDLPWNDSLGLHFTQLMGGSIFDINTSAYESLKSIGIDLIRNDELRRQITTVYSASYSHVETTGELLFKFIFDHLYPAIREHMQTVRPREMTVPVNLDSLRLNRAFLEDLHMTIFIYQITIGAYQQARENVVDLIANIEKELS